VAAAVPGVVDIVPAHGTFPMCIPVGGNLFAVAADDLSFPIFYIGNRVAFDRGQPVAHQLIGIVEILLDVAPYSTMKGGTINAKDHHGLPSFK
jgi:hypothetical protein